jgi:hypothetical protein
VGTTLTERLQIVKADANEFVSVGAHITAGFDKIDSNFIPTAKMVGSSAQSIPNNTLTKCAFNVAQFDSYAARSEGAMINLTNDEITIRKAGIYYLRFNGSFATSGTGVRRGDIRKNGVTLLSEVRTPSAGGACSLSVGDFFNLAVNDIIQAHAFQNSGGAINIDGNTFAEGFSLSATWQGNPT